MECERSDPNDPFRQGDILAAQPATEHWANPWTRFGVVISADCDLAQGKTGPTLVYIPVVSHYTYLRDIWAPSECERLIAKGRAAIDKRLAEFNPNVQFRHVNAWATDGSLQTRLSSPRLGFEISNGVPTAASLRFVSILSSVSLSASNSLGAEVRDGGTHSIIYAPSTEAAGAGDSSPFEHEPD
jgi:hypothetical protein